MADESGKESRGGGEEDDGLSPTARAMRSAQPYVDAVWKLFGGLAVGVLGGYFLDKYAGTGPWGLVGLSLVGIVFGFYAFISAMLRLDKRKK